MVNSAKVAAVADIAEKFRRAHAAVVTEYRGLSVSQLSQLRRALGPDTDYAVAKNTLVRRAAADAGVQGLDEMLVGPTAIAFIDGEPVDAAKALRDFAKANEPLVIKGGLLDGNAVGPAEVGRLADLESREVMLAQLAGLMKANLSKTATLVGQLPAQVARLAAALKEKRAADGSADPETDGADQA